MTTEQGPDKQLSPSEIWILDQLAHGLRPKELAARRGWSENTVSSFLARARGKLRCRTTIQAVIAFLRRRGELAGQQPNSRAARDF